jgi:hypothetical protein
MNLDSRTYKNRMAFQTQADNERIIAENYYERLDAKDGEKRRHFLGL